MQYFPFTVRKIMTEGGGLKENTFAELLKFDLFTESFQV